MQSLDTNLLVRLATLDNLRQVELSRQAIAEQDCWISITVVLELVWVLTSRYAWTAEQVSIMLSALMETEGFTLEDSNEIVLALTWFQAGADFSDALHLARSQGKSRMLTLDKNFCKTQQKSLKNPPIKVLGKTSK